MDHGGYWSSYTIFPKSKNKDLHIKSHLDVKKKKMTNGLLSSPNKTKPVLFPKD